MGQGVGSITVSAFVDATVHMRLHPPREHVTSWGEPLVTDWVLWIDGRADGVTLHVKDVAALWALHDLIAESLPARETDKSAAWSDSVAA